MLQVSTITQLLLRPRTHLPAFVGNPWPARRLLRQAVLPWAALAPLAAWLRGATLGAPASGLFLAVCVLTLQVGAWGLLTAVVPRAVGVLGVRLSRAQAGAIACVAYAPVWLASPLLALPDEPAALVSVARAGMVVGVIYGIVLLYIIFACLPVPAPRRYSAYFTAVAWYISIYLLLFLCVGITANAILYAF